jgi:hypothetical protein
VTFEYVEEVIIADEELDENTLLSARVSVSGALDCTFFKVPLACFGNLPILPQVVHLSNMYARKNFRRMAGPFTS